MEKLKLSTEQRIRLEHEHNQLAQRFENFQELQQKVQMVLQHRHQTELESYEAKYKQMEQLLEFQLQRSMQKQPQLGGDATQLQQLQQQVDDLSKQLSTAQANEHMVKQQLVTEKTKAEHNLELYLSTQGKLQQLQAQQGLNTNLSNNQLLQLIQLQQQIDLQLIEKGHVSTYQPDKVEENMENGDDIRYQSVVMLYKDIELLRAQRATDLEEIRLLKEEIENVQQNVGVNNGSLLPNDASLALNQQYQAEIKQYQDELNMTTNLMNKYLENENKLKAEITSLKTIITEQRTTLDLLQKQHVDIVEMQLKNNATNSASGSAAAAQSEAIIAAVEQANTTTEMHQQYVEQITQLKTQLITVQQENNSLIDDINTAQEQINKLTAEHSDLESTLVQTIEQHKILTNTANAQIKLVLDAVQKSRQERDEFRQDVIDKDEIITQLQIQYNQDLSAVKSNHNTGYISSLQTIQAELTSLQQELLGIREYMLNLQQQYISGDPATQQTNNNILNLVKNVLNQQQDQMAFLKKRYEEEVKLRKTIFNQLQDLKGNIRVLARVRPINQREIKDQGDLPDAIVVPPMTDNQMVLQQSVGGRVTQVPFEFERVFGPASTQENVFEEVKELISSCLDGYNVSLLAYGQTGSGKSHSMLGYPGQPGINPRALEMIFTHIQNTAQEIEWTMSLTIIEIYNDKIHDLLRTTATAEPLKIAQNPDGTNYLVGVNTVSVSSTQDVDDWFNKGTKNRRVSKTDMNDASSRSHFIMTLYVHGKNKINGQLIKSRLNIVDLAGSERVSRSGVTGDALKEAQNINASLSCLGNVIAARANKQGHVPYRNSALTHVLQDSLDKNGKTMMIICCSPAADSAGETLCSLRFGERAAKVEMGKAVKNQWAVGSYPPWD